MCSLSWWIVRSSVSQNTDVPSFLRRLWTAVFAAGPEPLRHLDDPVLGPLVWAEDAEAWTGHSPGFRFELAYDRLKEPSPAVVAYAREVLGAPSWLFEQLRLAKQAAQAGHPAFYAAEIEALAYDVISFSANADRRRIFATLGPGRDYRLWRIEFADRTCQGIGFDS